MLVSKDGILQVPGARRQKHAPMMGSVDSLPI